MSLDNATLPTVSFVLDGEEVTAQEGETIWQVAKREGTNIPHLCWKDAPGYRADGNCRACMVEIKGERVLAASCIRKPTEGMKVMTAGERVEKNRNMVFELLASDMPARNQSPDPESHFWDQMDLAGMCTSPRYPGGRPGAQKDIPVDSIFHDASHPSIAVNLDACISCGLCERACREVQVNDVIGMSDRGMGAVPVFDVNDPMGLSSCVACGECVQACPTGALMERTLLDETATKREVYPDTVKPSVCPFCGVGCQTEISLKNNDIIRVEGRQGPANRGKLCVKGRFGMDYVMSPERLTKPLIRRADAPKNAKAKLTFADIPDYFREASWEEAMALAAGGMTKVRDSIGGKAIAGFGSAKGTNEEAYLFQKYIRQGFGTNNVDHCTRLCHASSVAALMEGVGSGAVSAPFTTADESDCIMTIGCRPEQNHPVAATYFKQAAKRGTKLLVFDPRKQELMRHASHPVVFEPGRDVPMLNAMIHTIIEEGLFDKQYIQANVDGFEALSEKVKEFSPENMAEICGVEPDYLRELARTYATSERSIIFWGMGVSQHVHGTDNARCLIALSLITGQVGRPGTGLHPLRGQNNVQGASDSGLIPIVYPNYKSVEDPDIRAKYEDAWGRSLDPAKGLTVVEIMDEVAKGNIRAMYVQGENPAMSDPDQTHARAALASLDHLIVQDIFFTETAWFADVILPATAQPEKPGTYTNSNRQVQLAMPVRKAPGEARQDWKLIVEMAQRSGLDWDYSDISEVYAEMASHMASLDNISWDRLLREGFVCYPAKDKDGPGEEIIFYSGFPTKDGRAKLVPTDLLPPDELPDEEFPMVLTTGRMLEHWHTGAMTRRATQLNAQEDEPVVSMHPKDIGRKGLTRGQKVKVATRRGEVTLTLRADRDVTPGMLFMPFCFVEAPANFLTNPQLDPYGKIPEFKFSAAKISAASD
ncbi:formate dehydrogenase subunit alpha [Pseudohalocynthiibacter sp. F2068]|jgi:formate dehydrogenase major subunit|uniref:formate dehydrogenase subunit alpha n=1 Tax=Pseudohalocynthiibacter sp. F2068 TaxID=2926418 RepID=UPI001FF69FB4|nr:formate dehydrogenase subunit alpha [Pseudohalocynthiibacter sp. F2068]MCK0103611.1 formate dehydrogenase subunit alpha [Pseudohalocynthiibacter sp. F2068]